MRWKTHAAIALVASLAVFYFFLGVTDAAGLLALGLFAAISALVPDVDNKESKGREIFDLAIIVGVFFLSYSSSCGSLLCIPSIEQLSHILLTGLALLGLYFIFLKFAMPRHRGIIHSLLSCLIFTGVIYLLVDKNFALAGFVGYFSHLAADKELKLT